MEAWRRSLQPEVIDRWLVYAQIEPETFVDAGRQPPGGQQEQHVHMVDAWHAAAMLQRKYGGV